MQKDKCTQESTASPMYIHVKIHTQTKCHAHKHLHALTSLQADTAFPELSGRSLYKCLLIHHSEKLTASSVRS